MLSDRKPQRKVRINCQVMLGWKRRELFKFAVVLKGAKVLIAVKDVYAFFSNVAFLFKRGCNLLLNWFSITRFVNSKSLKVRID